MSISTYTLFFHRNELFGLGPRDVTIKNKVYDINKNDKVSTDNKEREREIVIQKVLYFGNIKVPVIYSKKLDIQIDTHAIVPGLCDTLGFEYIIGEETESGKRMGGIKAELDDHYVFGTMTTCEYSGENFIKFENFIMYIKHNILYVGYISSIPPSKYKDLPLAFYKPTEKQIKKVKNYLESM